MSTPGSPEFSAWFTQFRRSCFRLEVLQSYGSSGEDDSLRTFLAGQDPQPHPGKREWMALVDAATRDDRTMQRVHVITEPISDYLCFEVAWSYAYNVAAGEDVRLIPLPEDAPWPADIPQRDFWLFDDTVLFDMHYGSDGRWLGVERNTGQADIDVACRARAAALRHAQSWSAYVNSRPDLASRVPSVQWPR
ncbi:MAG: DUF6879 family protein [Pseudonocardiaceae bacterium]